MAAAATNLATIDSTLRAHELAAATHLAVLPAAADEVSAGVAQLFSQHAAEYQGVAGQAAAFHDEFVQRLGAGASSYASAEAANVATLAPAAPNVDPIVRVLDGLLGLVIFPIDAILNALDGGISFLINLATRPFYNFFIAPVVNAIYQAIYQAIFDSIFRAIFGAFFGPWTVTVET